jgi:Cu-Zn family superoxide dismutase
VLVLCGCAQQPGTQPDVAQAGAPTRTSTPREAEQVKQAIAVLAPVGDSGVSGTIRFADRGDRVEISGTVKGLTPGDHGFHVHQFGDLSDAERGEGEFAGGHFNPTDMPHGRPEESQRHVGDLGNITADESGTATFEKSDGVIKLSGPHSIIGRSIVVHAKADKFTQPTGDAGGRVAVGVIGIAKPPE